MKTIWKRIKGETPTFFKAIITIPTIVTTIGSILTTAGVVATAIGNLPVVNPENLPK